VRQAARKIKLTFGNRSCDAFPPEQPKEKPAGVNWRLPRYQKKGLNAGYASRPSHFWMPQVG
jgi:hypothetical protein